MKTIAKNSSFNILPKNLSPIIKTLIITAISSINYALLAEDLKIRNYGGIDSYGITGILSIAIVLLTIFLGLYTKRTLKYSYIGIFYLVLLFFVPQIFSKLPIFPFVYRIYGHIDYIIRTGYINPNLPGLGYQTWPGAMFLGAILGIISKVGLYILLTLPVLSYLINVPIFYLLLKGLTKDPRKATIGVLFWITGSYGFGWFVPGVLAGYLEMVGIYILFRFYLKRNENYSKFGIILMLLTLTLVFTHMLTSIFWAITMMDFLILSLFIKDKKTQTLSTVLLMLFIVFQFYWIFSYSLTLQMFKSRIAQFLTLFLRATKATEKWISITQTVLTQHAKILKIKAYFVYSIIGASLAGMSLVLAESLKRSIKTRKVDKLVFLLVLLLMSYSLGIPAIAGSYSGEISSRLLGGSKYIFVIFFTLALKSPKFRKVAIIVLFLFSYLHVMCTYGNLAYDYVAFNEVAGISYTSINIHSKVYTIYDPLWDMEYIGEVWQHVSSIDSLLKKKNTTIPFVVLSSRRIDGYKFFTGRKPNLMPIRIKSSKIYCSDNQYINVPSKFEIYYGG
ncbi:hypothetical protein [Thermococcus thermotolerans]|uniref:hypothetical protein n=1 Tax=Thermococcus thermotolerans TaxID=2969672 RepID=UPI002157A130|nr:hypothetical protein [Thermococcus thermotolerans]